MKIFLLLFTALFLFSASLLNYNIYERKNYIDIVLSLDSPYTGKLRFLKQKDGVSILLLGGISIESSSHEVTNNKFVNYIDFERYKTDNLLLKVNTSDRVRMEAAKVIGDFGIRVRIKPIIEKIIEKEITDTNPKLPTYKKNLGNSYLKVTLFLLLAFLTLLFVRLKVRKKMTPQKKSLSNIFFDGKGDDIKIIKTKYLDNHNKLILVTLYSKKYLLLVGNSNVLIDKIDDDSEEIDFDEIIKENEQNVNSFLEDNTQHIDANKDKLTSYTDKL